MVISDDDFYSEFNSFESNIEPTKTKTKTTNIHPYKVGLNKSQVKQILTSDDTPLNGWNRIIKSRTPHSKFEFEISKQFNRNFIASHFESEKERYFKMWNDKLIEEGL